MAQPRPIFGKTIKVPPQAMTQIASFARAQVSTDQSGGRVVTEPYASPILYQNIPCSIQKVRSNQTLTFNTMGQVIDHVVFTAVPVVSLLNGDFILYNQRAFTVLTVDNIAEIGVLYKITAKEYVTAASVAASADLPVVQPTIPNPPIRS